MSQTMEHTDSSSIRENDDPDKKQKSRRPPSTSMKQDTRALRKMGESMGSEWLIMEDRYRFSPAALEGMAAYPHT